MRIDRIDGVNPSQDIKRSNGDDNIKKTAKDSAENFF